MDDEIEYVRDEEIDIEEENRVLFAAGIACAISVVIVLVCWAILLGEL